MGIEPGTQDHAGNPCMIGGYDMYFTPIAAYRTWIDNVQALCDRKPGACKTAGQDSFFLASTDTGIHAAIGQTF